MKKPIAALIVLFVTFTAQAQDITEPLVNRELIFGLVNICAIILVIYLVTNFILQIMRQNFDYRLKTKIIEKGTAEGIVNQLVEPEKKDKSNNVLEWFFVLAGIAVGFLLMKFTRPYGIHSLAIMAFSIAAGFAGYYFTTRKTRN